VKARKIEEGAANWLWSWWIFRRLHNNLAVWEAKLPLMMR